MDFFWLKHRWSHLLSGLTLPPLLRLIFFKENSFVKNAVKHFTFFSSSFHQMVVLFFLIWCQTMHLCRWQPPPCIPFPRFSWCHSEECCQQRVCWMIKCVKLRYNCEDVIGRVRVFTTHHKIIELCPSRLWSTRTNMAIILSFLTWKRGFQLR